MGSQYCTLDFSSCLDVEAASIYVYNKLKLANYTSFTGIVLELKTKRERRGVYCIWGNNAPGRLTNPSCSGTSWNQRV